MKIYRNGVDIEEGLPVKVTRKTEKPKQAPARGRTHQEAGLVTVTEPADNSVRQVQLSNEHRALIRRREQLEGALGGLRMRRNMLTGEITRLRERIRQLSAKVGRPVEA